MAALAERAALGSGAQVDFNFFVLLDGIKRAVPNTGSQDGLSPPPALNDLLLAADRFNYGAYRVQQGARS